MRLFPLFADLSGREVLVVGGGEVATRKIEALLEAGARVQVHADTINASLSKWLAEGRIARLLGDFDPAWLDRVWLVVAATDDVIFNARLAAEAGQRRLLVNVVDDAALSSFQVPALVDRAPLLVAISSAGAAPMLARRLREHLEAQLDHSLGTFAGLFALNREAIRKQLPNLAQRRRWFEQVMDGPVPALLQSGQIEAAEHAFAAAVSQPSLGSQAGSVTLVGTGPGDPGLLTLKALRAMNQADLLVCDEAVTAAVLALARREASRMPLPADSVALYRLVQEHAKAGQRVVCLRPGNAFQHPPNDRLAPELIACGIVCEVIAGVRL